MLTNPMPKTENPRRSYYQYMVQDMDAILIVGSRKPDQHRLNHEVSTPNRKRPFFGFSRVSKAYDRYAETQYSRKVIVDKIKKSKEEEWARAITDVRIVLPGGDVVKIADTLDLVRQKFVAAVGSGGTWYLYTTEEKPLRASQGQSVFDAIQVRKEEARAMVGQAYDAWFFDTVQNGRAEYVLDMIEDDMLPPYLLTYAVDAIGLVHDDLATRAILALEKALNHLEVYVREGAVYGLEKLARFPLAQKLLKDRLEVETSPTIREVIEEALENCS